MNANYMDQPDIKQYIRSMFPQNNYPEREKVFRFSCGMLQMQIHVYKYSGFMIKLKKQISHFTSKVKEMSLKLDQWLYSHCLISYLDYSSSSEEKLCNSNSKVSSNFVILASRSLSDAFSYDSDGRYSLRILILILIFE